MMNSNYLSESDLNEMKAWEKIGMVYLTIQENAPANMFLSGITKQVFAVQFAGTDKDLNEKNEAAKFFGREECEKKKDFLFISVSRNKVARILSNEESKTAVDTYRVVKGIADRKVPEWGERLLAALGEHVSSQLKFILLMKFDSFSNEWRLVASDTANADSEFRSNNVQSYMAGLTK